MSWPRMKPWYGKTSDLAVNERYCTCCERELTAAFRYLELDQRTDTYHDLGGVPEGKSQGWFPFGLQCARKRIKEHSACISAIGERVRDRAASAGGRAP